MKNALIFAIVFGMLASCNKNSNKDDPDSTDIVGQWQYFQRNTSTGGPMTGYQDVPVSDQYTVTYNTNGNLEYSTNFPFADSGYNKFRFFSDTLEYSSTNNSRKYLFKVIRLTEQELQLSSLTIVCFEGCADKYRRQ